MMRLIGAPFDANFGHSRNRHPRGVDPAARPAVLSWNFYLVQCSIFLLKQTAYLFLLCLNPKRYSVMFHSPSSNGLKKHWRWAITLLWACTCAQGETWIVTDNAHPVTNSADNRVILLDEQLRLEEHLTSELPSNPTNAAPSLQSYLASPEGTGFQRELIQAQQGLTDAWNVGVEKVPAVVVDRCYVVYGEADVAKATALIDKVRSAPQ